MSIVLKFFPNGEFSQGVDTSHRRKAKRTKNPPAFMPHLDPKLRDEYLQWREDNEDILKTPNAFKKGSLWISLCGNDYTCTESGKDFCILCWSDTHGALHYTRLPYSLETAVFRWRLRPLVHQSVESCEKAEALDIPSSRKKLEGMTKNMSRNIRNGVYLLEQGKGGKDCLSFLTLTLPSLSSEGLLECCKNWDYMVKRFIDWLRTKVEGAGMNFMYVYATEIQTKRLELRNEYAPHLHLVFKGRNAKKKPWIITPKQARKAWGACISSIVNEPFNRDALENLQRIKYSAARYLSKYLSKGATNIPTGAAGDTIQALRTQWGGMARQVSRLIRANIVMFSGSRGHSDIINAFLGNLQTFVNIGYVSYFKKGFIELGVSPSGQCRVGLTVHTGALSTSTYNNGLDAILAYLSFDLQYSDCYE